MTAVPESEAVVAQFLRGFAAQVDVDPSLLNEPGVSLAPRPDRAESNSVAVYEVANRIVLWCDPAIADTLASLVATVDTVDMTTWQAALGAAQFELAGSGRMRVAPTVDWPLPDASQPYVDVHLDAETAGTVDLVKGLTDQCDPEEVEDAALDELDDFAEVAINVVTAGDDPSLVAYASAELWDWDDTFADIGVLVHPDHRNRGLGVRVAGRTTRELLDSGRFPLYRHRAENAGSSRVAERLGFQTVADLAVFTLGDS